MKNNKIVSHEVKSLLQKISTSNFDAIDIERLYIRLRFYYKNHELIWELGNFFGHKEERNKGISHEYIDRNFVKLRMVDDKYQLDAKKILKYLFDNIIIKSLEEINNQIILDTTQLTKKEAINFLKSNYEFNKISKYYVLKNIYEIKKIHKIIDCAFLNIHFKETIRSSEVLTQLKSALSDVNNLLKWNFNIDQIINPHCSFSGLNEKFRFNFRLIR